MRRRRSASAISVWPGFVDALSALLMLVIFMLLIYTLTQLYLSQSLTDRDSELSRLNARLVEISTLLGLESQRATQLSEQLRSAEQSLSVSREREAILQAEVDRLADTVDADRAQIQVLSGTQASLQRDIEALRALRAELEQEIDQQADRVQDLLVIVSEGERALAQSSVLTTAQQAQIAQLDRRIEQLQTQLRAIAAALELQEALTVTQEVELAALGERLNTLLAARVSELEQYQSEFFRNLRTVLADRDDIQIIGDRFVLPSELLFASGSAEIGAAGLAELAAVSALVLELTDSIPDEIEWILRVDGHTDTVPIQTARFPSNWDLSAARALSVVRYLEAQGVPAERLAATGFGEHQPIATGTTAEALRANRRIEFKLTNR